MLFFVYSVVFNFLLSGNGAEFWNKEFFHFLLVEFGSFCQLFKGMRISPKLTSNTEFFNHPWECGNFKLKNSASFPDLLVQIISVGME